MLRSSALLFLCPVLFACSSIPALTPLASITQEDEELQYAGSEEEEEEDRSVFVHILLYVPNRVIDAFDIVRAGVSVGPGIGVDLTATEWLNATLMAKASVGVGYQTLRHLPVEAAAYTMVGAGPVKLAADPGLDWYRSSGEFRVEVHAVIVGAHAVVEPFEIFDLLAGFLFFDPLDDDI